jgi:hypothetical protein
MRLSPCLKSVYNVASVLQVLDVTPFSKSTSSLQTRHLWESMTTFQAPVTT